MTIKLNVIGASIARTSLQLSRNGGTMARPHVGQRWRFTVKSIRTVVVATDFSFSAHRAARRAGLIAKERKAALHLLHVLDNSPIQALLRRSPAFDVEKPLVLNAQRSLDSLAEDVAAFASVVSARIVKEGRVMDEIIAGTASADLLVLGPRGINPVRDLLLGSTAERIARTLECPMLVVKQDPQIKYDNVVVPVDFSDYSLPAARFASELAPEAKLHILHALYMPLEGKLRAAGVSEEGMAQYRDQSYAEAGANMQELTASLNQHNLIASVRSGDARVLIPEYAAATGSTLIVMGKQGRSWLSEHILGSVTRHVLEKATCDVAVVPHG
jgi:nucleotide-binding universal stress UspA family protein